jgi:hypothetical protein
VICGFMSRSGKCSLVEDISFFLWVSFRYIRDLYIMMCLVVRLICLGRAGNSSLKTVLGNGWVCIAGVRISLALTLYVSSDSNVIGLAHC